MGMYPCQEAPLPREWQHAYVTGGGMGATSTDWAMPLPRRPAPILQAIVGGISMGVRSSSVGKGPVLVIDDDADMLAMVEMVVGSEGYRVLTAANGEEGLEQVSRQMPSLILLDMRMPVMDGWRFTEEFRSRYNRRAPIIVMTAAENAKARAEEIKADGYLAKPFDLDQLFACVRR